MEQCEFGRPALIMRLAMPCSIPITMVMNTSASRHTYRRMAGHTGAVGKEGELIRRMEAVALNWQSILDTFTKYWVQQLCALILCLITW